MDEDVNLDDPSTWPEDVERLRSKLKSAVDRS